jgi:RNA polymerase sigma-70 factor (ECF subfamily)
MPAPEAARIALVAALRRGEAAARRRFFESYRDLVERVLRRALGSTDELDDLLNEVMISAVEAIHMLRDPQALPGWVVGIAANAARKKRRASERRPWVLTANGSLPEQPISSDYDAREALSSVRELLERLHPQDREALILCRVEELPIRKAAQQLGLTPSTLKRRLERGEQRLLRLAYRSTALQGWLRTTPSSVT